jgi:ribonuclease P protein component
LTKVNGFYCLKKTEIIRGHNSFKNILVDSKVLSNSFLKVYIQYKKENSEIKDIQILKDPLNNVKVGFVVSKRVVAKASLRNRLKRLLREAYRLNKHIPDNFVYNKVYLLFGYSERYKKEFNKLDIEIVKINMRMLMEKVVDYLNKQK